MVGAVIGGATGAISAAQKCGRWSDVAWSAAAGAVSGAAGGIALGFGGTVAVGAIAGFAGDAAGTYITSGGFNFDDSASAGLLGALSGAGGLGLAKIGMGGRMSAGGVGVLNLLMTLKYNHDTGGVSEGCTCP